MDTGKLFQLVSKLVRLATFMSPDHRQTVMDAAKVIEQMAMARQSIDWEGRIGMLITRDTVDAIMAIEQERDDARHDLNIVREVIRTLPETVKRISEGASK